MNLEQLLKQKIAFIKAQPIEIDKVHFCFMFINDLFSKNPDFDLSQTKLVLDSMYQNFFINKIKNGGYYKTEINAQFLKIINKNNKNALIWFYDSFIKDSYKSQYFERSIQLIKELEDTSLKLYLINHAYENLLPESYQAEVLKPLYSGLVKSLDGFPIELLTYYIDKKNKTNLWNFLEDLNKDVQLVLIDKLIANQCFKTVDSYNELLNYTKSLSVKSQNIICEKVFEYEKNIELITVFEDKFNAILQNKELNVRMIQPILNKNNLERRNYLFNKFFTKGDYLTAAINIVFIADSGQKKRESLINFTDMLLKNHFSGSVPLNSDHFAIMIKRSFHCGMFNEIFKTMNGLYNDDKDLFHEVSDKINSPLITIKGYGQDIVLKFHIDDMQSRFKTIFNNLLEQSLPIKEEKSIKKKI